MPGTIDHLYVLHGWLLYISWGVLFAVQVGSVRYLRFKWRWNMWLHGVSGLFAGLVSVFSSQKMLSRFVKLGVQEPHTF